MVVDPGPAVQALLVIAALTVEIETVVAEEAIQHSSWGHLAQQAGKVEEPQE